MSKGIALKLTGTISLIIFTLFNGYSQEREVPSVRFMFYNVENLFDIYDDPLTEDDDFLPDGLMRWNFTRYNRKINSLYKTIIAAGDWNPPAVVALCEIENRKVLEDLLYGTNLVKFNYGIIHEDSPDLRGIDVSLIYRKDQVKIISYRYWIPKEFETEAFASRSILYVKCVVQDDTLHLFANHWPSRRGGVLAAEKYRMDIAELVRSKIDSISVTSSSRAKVIITGDFNCTPEDPAIKRMTTPTRTGIALVNLSDTLSQKGFGTYRYMGIWELIDQVIVSDWLLKSKSGLSATGRSFRIFKPDFLLKNDPKYPGLSPFATYLGYRYQGGYSDHLPVLLDLIFN